MSAGADMEVPEEDVLVLQARELCVGVRVGAPDSEGEGQIGPESSLFECVRSFDIFAMRDSW
jgi:hypothetical protein